MKNFKPNINREPLSDKDIASGKNFEQVLASYHVMRSPFFKSIKFRGFSSVALVAVAVLVIVYFKSISPEVKNAAQPFINPPIAHVNVPYETFSINTETDSIITTKTGSIIHLPANAFCDKNGKVLHDKVELKYREFHELSEVFMAGIPMTYDSGGTQYNFETAGMMELTASCNGADVQTNPEALIDVKMVSYDTTDRFNTYYLDTATKKWNYVAQSNFIPAVAGVPSQSKDSTIISENLINRETKSGPVNITTAIAPKKQNPGLPKFKLTADSNEFPELAMYKGLKFQVIDTAHYDPDRSNTIWDDVELMRAVNGRYKITFKKGSEKYVVIAEPVIDEKDFAGAQKIYEEYGAKLAAKKQARAERQLAERKKQREVMIERNLQQAIVYRIFQIANFGYWNGDHPCNLPMPYADIMARFINRKTGEAVNLFTTNLVVSGKKLIYTNNPCVGTAIRLRFDTSESNMLWAITEDGKIAVIRAGNFKKQVGDGLGEKNLTVEVVDKKFENENEVKNYLGI